MVLKLNKPGSRISVQFYSSVILNGTETMRPPYCRLATFYSSVILNGTETRINRSLNFGQFYSSVILNGTETFAAGYSSSH